MTSEEHEAQAERYFKKAGDIACGEVEVKGDPERIADKKARRAIVHFVAAARMATGVRRRELFETAIQLTVTFHHADTDHPRIIALINEIDAMPKGPLPGQAAFDFTEAVA